MSFLNMYLISCVIGSALVYYRIKSTEGTDEFKEFKDHFGELEFLTGNLAYIILIAISPIAIPAFIYNRLIKDTNE